MQKLVFSWLAVEKDFTENGAINETGPTVIFHVHHFDYDFHYLLCTPDYQFRAAQMKRYIEKNFPNNRIKIITLDIGMAHRDLNIIKNKVEALLMQYRNNQIDMLISTGSGLMKIAWYICHTTLGLNSRLIQIIKPIESKNHDFPDIYTINVQQSTVPTSALILEHNQQKKTKKAFYISRTLKKVYNRAFKVAQADNVSCLIVGNTGTGKEFLARYIHNNSPRKHRPFIAVNCAAFSDQLLESRLFGYKAGSFTGAVKDYNGLIYEANKGTIFLDEIADMGLYMQQALLRFIQQKEIQPIGGKAKKVDVRVIAATNKNIHNLVKEGKFRADLLFRLNLTIMLPDLKDYPEKEKKEYINFFLKTKTKQYHLQQVPKFHNNILSFLLKYNYPGNFREMESIFDNLFVFREDNLHLKELPTYIFDNSNQTAINPDNKLETIIKQHILNIYKLNKENKTKTAKELGISYNNLKAKLQTYGVE
jgi:transcriptional regulator with PAS, ATPase and Fis domain